VIRYSHILNIFTAADMHSFLPTPLHGMEQVKKASLVVIARVDKSIFNDEQQNSFVFTRKSRAIDGDGDGESK